MCFNFRYRVNDVTFSFSLKVLLSDAIATLILPIIEESSIGSNAIFLRYFRC